MDDLQIWFERGVRLSVQSARGRLCFVIDVLVIGNQIDCGRKAGMSDSEVSGQVDVLVMRETLEEVGQFFVVRIVPRALSESYYVE